MPYFWISGGEYAAFVSAAEDDPSIENLTRLDEAEGVALYRGEWVEDVETVAYAFTQAGAALLDATGRDGQWQLQLRFDERADCTRFQTYIAEDGLSVDLHRLYNPTQPRAGTPGLTELQQETLVSALEAGYYEFPWAVTMEGTGGGARASPSRRWPNGSEGLPQPDRGLARRRPTWGRIGR